MFDKHTTCQKCNQKRRLDLITTYVGENKKYFGKQICSICYREIKLNSQKNRL